MSYHVVRSDDNSDGTAGQSFHLYQSVWMAHWMHTNCKPEGKGYDPLSLECQYREDGDSKQLGPKIPSKISKSVKAIREFPVSRTFDIMNESLKLSSAILGKERIEGQSLPQFNSSQNLDGVIALRNVTSGNGEVSELGTSSGGCHFQHEGILWNLEQQVKSPDSLEKKSLAVSTSFQHDVGSSSKIVPCRNNTGKSPLYSFTWEQDERNQPNHFVTDFRRSGTSSSRQNNMRMLPVSVGKQREDLRYHYGTRSFPHWSSHLDTTKSETLFHEFCSVPRIPCSLRDVETMRICTTVDSMEELSRCPPALLQTTHHFPVTKRDGVDLSEGGQVFGDSTFSTNLKGKLINEFLSLSPDCGFHGQQGVKLQPLGSSMDSEGEENLIEARSSAFGLKNESSAETETMDMDAFNQDNFSGVVSSLSNKNTKVDQMLSISQAAVGSSGEETGGRFPNTELSDMNNEIPSLPAITSLADDSETSTSRTQSLDVDHLLSHAELPRNSKSSCLQDDHVELESCSRWVKRLKLSALGSFAVGTRSSTMEEANSHEKISKVFSKIMKCSLTNSEPTMGKCPNKEPMAPDQTAALSRNGKSSSTETVRKIEDVTGFNPWIRRWCHRQDPTPTQIHEALVVCKPRGSNATLEEFGKKQFPSIAAMALMGKALSTFQPCAFRKKGTYIVWNS